MADRRKPAAKTVFVISGATGRTCDVLLRAALAQFGNPEVAIVRRTKVRSSRAAVKAVREASEQSAVIFHSLVSPRVRKSMIDECERRRVPAIDVLGPALTLLEDHFNRKPRRRPGLSYQFQKERFERIDAVDFTLAHDDGCGLADLDRADVVVVGVSRSSKSVTCFYLAYRGVRAANVPLVPGCEPPAPLLKLEPAKVFGLTMNPRRLYSLRQARAEALGEVSVGSYVDERGIARELRDADRLIEQQGWQKIDVSYLSVEEVATQILNHLRVGDDAHEESV
jgi:hypothetical protein